MPSLLRYFQIKKCYNSSPGQPGQSQSGASWEDFSESELREAEIESLSQCWSCPLQSVFTFGYIRSELSIHEQSYKAVSQTGTVVFASGNLTQILFSELVTTTLVSNHGHVRSQAYRGLPHYIHGYTEEQETSLCRLHHQRGTD